jgi:hypothetical protein
MATRKGWNDLSVNYRNRLQRKGITEKRYTSGESTKSARGHSVTPEHRPWRARAVRKGIEEVIPDYWELPRVEQELLGEQWYNGFFAKGQGSVVNPNRRKRAERIKRDKFGAITNPDRKMAESVQRSVSRAQVEQKMDFQQYLRENTDSFDEAAFYKEFRELYKLNFSA